MSSCWSGWPCAARGRGRPGWGRLRLMHRSVVQFHHRETRQGAFYTIAITVRSNSLDGLEKRQWPAAFFHQFIPHVGC